ncbi:hypothetical protein B0H34DRAFT_798941 [Crassisporium funariophilum]|nr:hypothetical protein B0H34DRAFT_798941 [Crassisporium funariophilum]
MSSFAVPTRTQTGIAPHTGTLFHPTSSRESLEGTGSHYSIPFSAGSRTSWSSSEVDWARRAAGIEESHRALQQENAELSKQIIIWKAKFETLQEAYISLLDRVPTTAPVALAEPPKLSRDDFKLIDYWYKYQWVSSSEDCVTDLSGKVENENDDEEVEMDLEGETSEQIRPVSPAPGALRGQGRSRQGINVSMRYIQDKDGQVINGHRAQDIRNYACAIFVGFATEGKQILSWGDADAVTCRFYYSEMESRFEELQYCDLDWKAEQIAIDTFPGWKVTWHKRQKKMLQDHGKKRPRRASSIEEPDTKRPKDMAETSMSSQPPLETSTTFQVAQQPVPVVNIIPNTPIRPPPPAAMPASFVSQVQQHQFRDSSHLQPNLPHYNFSINNPLAMSNNLLTTAAMPLVGQLPFAGPVTAVEPQPQQALEADSTQPIPGNSAPAAAPAKRSHTGTTKMRPSKTSITPRNLCALEWAISNPKGTTDEFGTYYDSLLAEVKQKWETLSVEAKESGKTASEWILGRQS